MPEITRHGPEAIDEVRHLWLALRDHHATLHEREQRPVRGDDDSWGMRRDAYRRWLAQPGAFVLLARDDDGAVAGYALVRPDDPAMTWEWPARPALLETLSVSPDARGGGLGSALLARVREECRREGFDTILLGAMAANRDALRFYEREGFVPEAVMLRDTTYTP